VGVAVIMVGLLSGGATAGAAPTFCDVDQNCAAGELCVRNACLAPECLAADTCAKGELCLAYRCQRPSCRGAQDCSGEMRCLDGVCQPPLAEIVGADRREMVLVRGGAFLMGSSAETAVSDEKPAHWVELDAFWLDRYEVRVADFMRCVDAGACALTGLLTAAEEPRCNYGSADGAGRPMNCVAWDGAATYCAWAGKRLPTEAEWERAAGGGQGYTYVWGNAPPHCDRVCRKDKDDGCGSGRTCLSGEKTGDVSPVGAYDMGGNVGEWVADWYDATYYRSAPRLRPRGPETGERKVVRGGDFTNLYDPFRLVTRNRLIPTYRSVTVGFRCARDL